MSFVQNFTASQQISTPNLLVIQDTSTGTDGAIVDREVFLQKADGTYLVVKGVSTNYMDFPLSAGSTISYDVLDKDYALNITVNWLDIAGNVLHTQTVLYCFSTYAQIYDTKLSKAQIANPSLIDNNNWLSTKFALTTYIRAANDGVGLGVSISILQLSLSKAKYIIDHPKLVF